MLGLIQFTLLLYIRKQGERIDMKNVQEFAWKELVIRSHDQTNITVRRLADRGLVDILPCKMVKYVKTEENEALIDEILIYCDRAIKLAS